MRYRFIKQHSGQYPVRLLCRSLEVSRSAYYAWAAAGAERIEAEELAIRRCIKEHFKVSRESCGSRRMVRHLREEGYRVGRYRVRRLMRQMGLVVKRKQRFRVTTNSRHDLPVAENVLDRQFAPAAPNRVWATDITYIWTREGWVYLAVVIDLFSRRVVGWQQGARIDTGLVTRALRMAIGQRKPPPGLIHHSDRGSQYASRKYRRLLKAHGMVCSMSRKGNCWDNAPVERFFSSLKREWIGDRLYWTRQEAMGDVRAYITMYYNTHRLHSTLGYQSPAQYEKAA